jgi:hypothetical protein
MMMGVCACPNNLLSTGATHTLCYSFCNFCLMQNSYLPTMPEDQFVAVLQALKAKDGTGRFCGRLDSR